MKILDRYILKKFLTTFFFVVSMLVMIIVVIDFTDKNEKFIKMDVPAGEIVKYYLAYIPWIASLITPITVFIATVLVTAGLAVKTEIVAILSAGISFRRMMIPYFIGSFMIAVLSFYLNGWLIPNSNKYKIGFEMDYFKKSYNLNEKDMHIKVDDDTYLYIQAYSNNKDIGFRVTLEKMEGTKLIEKLTAKKMTWDTATHKWRLQSWTLRKISGFEETFESGMKMDTAISVSPDDFEMKYNLFETLTIDELNDYIARQQARGADDVMIYQIEKYIRYMLPFTAIILTFMGITVSAEKSTRGGAGFKIALGFLIAFVFIIFFILSKAIAEAGSINPLLAIWIPNIIGSVLGLIMYQFVPR